MIIFNWLFPKKKESADKEYNIYSRYFLENNLGRKNYSKTKILHEFENKKRRTNHITVTNLNDKQMKQEDFNRLKAVCEKEGFEIGFKYDESTYTVRLKKDIWQDVEFAESVKSGSNVFTDGKIYRFNPDGKGVDDFEFLIDNNNESNGFTGSNRDRFKPSTESAYVEQLKAEAFKRFGEIKEGQKLKRDFDISIDEICTIGECKNTLEFKYFKFNDSLEFCGSIIYQQGKWATRVKERVKVNVSDIIANKINTRTDFTFSITTRCIDEVDFKKFLASKLEKYLNKD